MAEIIVTESERIAMADAIQSGADHPYLIEGVPVVVISDARAVAAEIRQMRHALERISAGNWNHGNLRPGLTVTQYAREVLG